MFNSAQKGHLGLIVLLLVLVLGAGSIFYFKSQNPKTVPSINITPENSTNPTTTEKPISNMANPFKTFSGKDLKISFKYPKDWFVNEKYFDLMITSYKTYIGEGRLPAKSDIRININEASLCQQTLDEDVEKGGCGEGVNTKNQVLSKEVKNYSGNEFITYKIKYPNSQPATFYYLKKGDQILQISKSPNPSQFEKEFEALIKSIQFN